MNYRLVRLHDEQWWVMLHNYQLQLLVDNLYRVTKQDWQYDQECDDILIPREERHGYPRQTRFSDQVAL